MQSATVSTSDDWSTRVFNESTTARVQSVDRLAGFDWRLSFLDPSGAVQMHGINVLARIDWAMARGGGFDTGQVQVVDGPPRYVGSVPVTVVAGLAQLQEACHVARVVGAAPVAPQSELVHVQKFIRATRISERLDPIG
jgi:hypothetical protein